MNIDTKNILTLPKRGSWGGYNIERVGGRRVYFWIGRGNEYVMSITKAEALKLAKFFLK